MSQPAIIARTGRGLVEGVIGTAVMTGWQEVSAKARNALSGPEGRATGGGSGETDPWANASAPAKVGRLMLRALGYEVPADKIDLLTNVMHWGYGTSWGAVYGALGENEKGHPLRRGLVFGTGVWAMSYVILVPIGIYQPPWRYSPSTLAMDLSYHLAYGLGVGAGGAVVGRVL